jgi:hypothetical protein
VDPVDPQVNRFLGGLGSDPETGAPNFWGSVDSRKSREKASNGGGEDFPPPHVAADGTYDPNADLDWMGASCWAPRKVGKTACDAKSFLETRECLQATFEKAWQFTSDGMASKSGRVFGSKPLGNAAEVRNAVKQTMQQWYPMLHWIFVYYSCIGSETNGKVHGISYLGFSQFLEDARLVLDPAQPNKPVARHAKPRGEDGFDLLWVTVNSTAVMRSEFDSGGSKGALSRTEFLELLVRAAIDEKSVDEMHQFVQELLEDLLSILSRHPYAPTILHNPDGFRSTYCYRKEVCAVLDHHRQTLLSLFTVYCAGGKGQDGLGQSSLLGPDEWVVMLSELGFVKELTYRRIMIMFAQSRMITIDENERKSWVGQLNQLTFEGFLEAIVRLALVKSLPTDKEMHRAGYYYPGEFLGALLDKGLPMYNAWQERAVRIQRSGRGDAIWRRLDMLILLIVSVVQYGVEKQPGGATLLVRGTPDEILSMKEVEQYHKKPTPYVFEAQGDVS